MTENTPRMQSITEVTEAVTEFDQSQNPTVVYTDGSCLGNPGVGGWGLVARLNVELNSELVELSGSEAETTNNRMEIMAVIKALELTCGHDPVVIYTDSQYVQKGITEWLAGWKRNNWRTAAKKPVKNQDLWRLLDEGVQGRSVKFQWVKAHAGIADNERADQLAREAAESL